MPHTHIVVLPLLRAAAVAPHTTVITAKAIAGAGIEPLSLDASGSYANGTLTLANADLDVGGGVEDRLGRAGVCQIDGDGACFRTRTPANACGDLVE